MITLKHTKLVLQAVYCNAMYAALGLLVSQPACTDTTTNTRVHLAR
jgi:hypothetical protein